MPGKVGRIVRGSENAPKLLVERSLDLQPGDIEGNFIKGNRRKKMEILKDNFD
jgi:hypothetical protein